MKKLNILLFLFVCLASSAAIGQDKLAVTNKEKVKPAKAERQFSIIEKGALLTKATFRKDPRATVNVIEIEALNTNGGSVSGLSSLVPPATISDITSISGNYLSARDVSKSGRGVVMQLLDVTYPYRGRINVSGQMLEFEITEPGFWKISLAVAE